MEATTQYVPYKVKDISLAEWGRKEIVKMLLQSPSIDASLTDCVRLFLSIRVKDLMTFVYSW